MIQNKKAEPFGSVKGSAFDCLGGKYNQFIFFANSGYVIAVFEMLAAAWHLGHSGAGSAGRRCGSRCNESAPDRSGWQHRTPLFPDDPLGGRAIRVIVVVLRRKDS